MWSFRSYDVKLLLQLLENELEMMRIVSFSIILSVLLVLYINFLFVVREKENSNVL